MLLKDRKMPKVNQLKRLKMYFQEIL